MHDLFASYRLLLSSRPVDTGRPFAAPHRASLVTSPPVLRPPCFTLTSRYPPPYEADNHLLSRREDVARYVGGRCKFRKLDLDIVLLFPRFTINLILSEKYS